MALGLGTYSYAWHWGPDAPVPISLPEMIKETHDLGGAVFQICDYPSLESLDDDALGRLRDLAQGLGVRLELGTRGVQPGHLRRYLHLAERLGATTVRSMLHTRHHRPEVTEATAMLREIVPEYEQRGVRVALETYEQVSTRDLVDVVEAVDSESLGICLDPANCVAALEHPMNVARMAAPYVLNWHVKDFAFTRRDGWAGFNLVGAPLGSGLLPYDEIAQLIRPDERGVNQIVEHWLPRAETIETTLATEDAWTATSLAYLRSHRAG